MPSPLASWERVVGMNRLPPPQSPIAKKRKEEEDAPRGEEETQRTQRRSRTAALVSQQADAVIESIEALCRSELAHFKVPKFFRVVDRFPLTASGKVQKFVLKEESSEALRGT
ncbi:hypothetical protein EMIHUDRAFT_252729 [Emiliania huxleyi CCMP1516]|uniref:AMP-binding enzyme C-terminal domain-containing protein n=2 Tax=Emiliania huxleyi TaxID=2903 RepID=A0A0D3KGM3_EMIH1|nr:hypothetical protein EMIHUDRAFT_252729 [Emiliania huxleyi CCMP1516]EOD34908.1 hypothetical protein EMIHUDRAFT_252729 [Emiliania huxleyi CCMP1516]|eukprot:XP_005787337.1 hypothetical protein EMIHUDRAFT_252729 [Emiliania huxleyi CCMP1516]